MESNFDFLVHHTLLQLILHQCKSNLIKYFNKSKKIYSVGMYEHYNGRFLWCIEDDCKFSSVTVIE